MNEPTRVLTVDANRLAALEQRVGALIEALDEMAADGGSWEQLRRRLAALRAPGVGATADVDMQRDRGDRLAVLVNDLSAALATARRERDEAVENAANAALADAETIETCRETISRQREMIAARDAELARLREERDALMAWRCDVTVALGQPQGTFYADVPKLIRDALARIAELEARDREGRWLVERSNHRQVGKFASDKQRAEMDDYSRRADAYLSGTPPADPAWGLIERAVPVCEDAAECQHDGPGLCRGCGLAVKAVAADLRAYLAAKEGR